MASSRTAIVPSKYEGAVKQDDLLARYTYMGSSQSDSFDVDVIIGSLSKTGLGYDNSIEEHIGHVSSAAKVRMTHRYDRGNGNPLGILLNLRQGTSFGYNDAVLLRNLAKESDIEEAVTGLTDRQALEKAGHTWQVSVVGLAGIRVMRRQLFIASGELELNVPINKIGPLTDPQLRASTISIMGAVTLDVFFSMPPEPLQQV